MYHRATILSLLVFFTATIRAQTDTLWFDAEWQLTGKPAAEFYRTTPVKENGFYRITDYYRNGAKQCEGLSQSPDDSLWQGKVVWFYPDGDTLQTAHYETGALNGQLKTFYNASQIYSIRNFVNGKEEGRYMEYYPDGSMLGELFYRDGIYNGIMTRYFRNGQVKYTGKLNNGYQDSVWTEYFDNGKMKSLIDYSMGEVKGRHYIFEEEDSSFAKLEISNDTLISAALEKRLGEHTFHRRMELTGKREHWTLSSGNILLLEYFFEGYNRAGVWTKYADDGKTVIERFAHKNSNCYFSGNVLLISHYGFGALEEKFTMTDFEPDKSEDCLTGKGEFMTTDGKRVAYRFKKGRYQSTLPQDFPRAQNMAETQEITIIDETWDDAPQIEVERLPKLSGDTLTVNDIAFTRQQGTFDGIGLTLLSHPDYQECKAAWKSLTPGENELIFFFDEDGLLKAKMGNSARIKYKRNILRLDDLSACICQLMKEEHFYYRDVKDILFYASERLFREADDVSDDDDYDNYQIVMPAAVVDAEEAEPVFVFVEDMPQFPGGDAAMLQFIRDSLSYPVEAQEKNIEGKVILQFTVFRNGSVGDIKVLWSANALLDAEAIRVVQSMPKWIPGKQRGKEVNTQYNLPIVFKLQ